MAPEDETRRFLWATLKRWLREPLLHFLILGAVLFANLRYINRGRGGVEPSRQIVLSLDDLREMEVYFESQWHRQPTPRRVSGHGGGQGSRGSALSRSAWPWASTKTTPSSSAAWRRRCSSSPRMSLQPTSPRQLS